MCRMDVICVHGKYTGMGIIGLHNFDVSVGIVKGDKLDCWEEMVYVREELAVSCR